MLTRGWNLRDHRDPRDAARPWVDPPGWFGLGWRRCNCCSAANAYHAGGQGAISTPYYATTDKQSFSTDATAATTTANLTIARSQTVPVANPDTAGYFGGGRSASVIATTDKLTFSGDSTSAVGTANLSSARAYAAGVSERSTKGYYLGGSTSGGAPGAVTSDKLTFSGDSASAATTANLSAARYGISGLSEGSTKGYVGGGLTAPGAYVATADKIVFSTDATAAQTTANLTTARQGYVSMSDGSTKGYWAGGQTGASISICDKVTFSTDVTSSQTSAAINQFEAGGSSNGTKGYFAGGGGVVVAVIYKFDFSTDTNSLLSPASDLSVARTRLASLSTAAL